MKVTNQIVQEILTGISHKELVLLCGAGISIDAPSNLPNAKELTHLILKALIGQKFPVHQFDNLRPEVIFQRIQEYDEVNLYNSLSSVLKTNQFNLNHIFGAYLLQNKINIITTNFDTLLEDAADYLKIKYYKSVFNKQKQPAVFKIHGSIENKLSLKLSINQVNQGLANWKKSYLNSLLKNKILLVLGYSGLDQLDILPVLKNSNPNKIIWINHISNAKKITKPNDCIKQLSNLTYINLNTRILVEALLKNLIPKRQSKTLLNPRYASLTYLELLEHENRYPDILRYIKGCQYQKDVRIQVFKLISEGSKVKRSKNYRGFREALTNKIFKKASTYKNGLLTFMGDAANTPKRWEIIEKLYDRELQKGNTNYYLIESIIGYTTWMIDQNKFKKAKFYLNKIKSSIKQEGFTLLEARAAIARGDIIKREYDTKKIYAKEISLLKQQINNAMFLTSKEIFNDEYFYFKASIIKAFVLIYQNQTISAKKILRKAIRYFKSFSINSHIDALDLYSTAMLKEGNTTQALRYLDKAIDLDNAAKRKYFLGNLLRKKACLIGKKNRKKFNSLLIQSKEIFEKEFFLTEAERSRKLIIY